MTWLRAMARPIWSSAAPARSRVSELAAAGVASILVPFPHAVDDHQTHNAAFLADAGARW
jgi:UDP-N-acetylglucosamine--N-acetylmuramyl-(pentapeptide) pyrophosphoryl-undecaprenol N-acetylglucosamine transferase